MAGKSFDEKIVQVLQLKTHNTYPEGMDTGRRYTLRRFAAKFSLEGGTLYHSAKGRKVLVVHTRKEALNLFHQYHSSPYGGHQGSRKTREAMTSRYYWPGMTNDIEDWVARCTDCQKVGKELKVDTTLKSMQATAPWELLGMDLMGPYPITKNGYQYIMTVTDYFTRWVEAYPLKKKSAYEVTRNLYRMILRFGCPRRILTDRGSEFNNMLNREFCEAFKIERSFTSPYHPQMNGLAESTNRSIKGALRKYVSDAENDWDDYLDGILFSLRTKPNMSTKMSPFRLMHGFEVLFPDQVPENYILPSLSQPTEEQYQQFITDLYARKAADAAIALTNLTEAQKRQQRQYSARHTSKHGKITFDVGQSVLLLNARRKTRKGGSLQPTYRGPYKITSIVGKRVRLETMSGTVLGSMYSICHLKPFKEPAPGVTDKVSEEKITIDIADDDSEKKSPPESMGKVCVECHSTGDSITGSIEVIKTEEKYSGVQALAIPDNSDVNDIDMEVVENKDCCKKGAECHITDDMYRSIEAMKMEEEHSGVQALAIPDDSISDDTLVGEDKEWFQKVRSIQTHHYRRRVEAKLGNLTLWGSSFHGLKPREWLTDEVIDAYLYCVVKDASDKVQAISSVISTSILSGRAATLHLKKRGIIQKDIVLLPFNEAKHWVIMIALMETEELLIIDPLCQETSYAEKVLRKWKSFLYQEYKKSSRGWKTKILEHKAQSDGHNCGPLILRFAESYVEHEDLSSVETTEEAMNSFRRQIAIRLLKESDSVEDYCIYCNFVSCPGKPHCMMVQCECCERWAHIPCLPDAMQKENLQDDQQAYKCNKCS